jgi:hypothetical protein
MLLRNRLFKWVWWWMPVIPALGIWRQEDHEFEACLGYMVRPCLKNKQKQKRKTNKIGHLISKSLKSFQ